MEVGRAEPLMASEVKRAHHGILKVLLRHLEAFLVRNLSTFNLGLHNVIHCGVAARRLHQTEAAESFARTSRLHAFGLRLGKLRAPGFRTFLFDFRTQAYGGAYPAYHQRRTSPFAHVTCTLALLVNEDGTTNAHSGHDSEVTIPSRYQAYGRSSWIARVSD